METWAKFVCRRAAGGNLLDRCCILGTSDVAGGWDHAFNDFPLLIAGKGHETGQIVKGVTIPFSDFDVARKALDDVGGSHG